MSVQGQDKKYEMMRKSIGLESVTFGQIMCENKDDDEIAVVVMRNDHSTWHKASRGPSAAAELRVCLASILTLQLQLLLKIWRRQLKLLARSTVEAVDKPRNTHCAHSLPLLLKRRQFAYFFHRGWSDTPAVTLVHWRRLRNDTALKLTRMVALSGFVAHKDYVGRTVGWRSTWTGCGQASGLRRRSTSRECRRTMTEIAACA